MRIASFVFLGLVLALLANLAVSVAYPPYREFVRDFRTTLVPGYTSSKTEASTQTSSGVNTSHEDTALAESLSKMNAWLDVLIASSGSGVQSATISWAILPKTAEVSTGKTTTGAIEPKKTEDIGIPLSGLLLTRLMPDFLPKKVENKGIFDIHIFNTIEYTTYADTKSKIRLYAFGETYSVMLSNLKLVSNVYTVNETDTFFDSTFFLNATTKKDSTIRFVTELEGKAVGIEIPKSLYPKLKKLLLKK